MLFAETPSNPGLALVDLAAIGALAAEQGLDFVVDSCFATPRVQQPIAFGATAVGIGDGMIRVSVGLEHVDDIGHEIACGPDVAVRESAS
jgi:cystathionine beta-lyase/cystathionine gamma-synthase